MQTISSAGAAMIAKFEGFSATPYNDPPGSSKYSIGYGHQILPGENLTHVTKAEAEILLRADVGKAEKAVREIIKVPLTSGQFDSLVSFVYNVGVSAFKTGTVPAKVNAGKFADAATTMKKYTKAGGVENKVLAARRDLEAQAFIV